MQITGNSYKHLQNKFTGCQQSNNTPHIRNITSSSLIQTSKNTDNNNKEILKNLAVLGTVACIIFLFRKFQFIKPGDIMPISDLGF